MAPCLMQFVKPRKVLPALAALGIAAAASAQTPDNPSRLETTRERENPARAVEPPDRNNPDRIDPELAAELEQCAGLEDAEQRRCVEDAKRRFGEM